jgi:predicted GIY-YIG superfamily endonuclease
MKEKRCEDCAELFDDQHTRQKRCESCRLTWQMEKDFEGKPDGMNRGQRVYCNETMPVHVVYVIKWNDGTYYIEQTFDFHTRMAQHSGKKYAKMHQGIKESRVLHGGMTREQALSVEKLCAATYKRKGLTVYSR